MRSGFQFTLLAATTLAPLLARSEEGGSGHYLPGATASFVDALPGREAFASVSAFTYYYGSAGASRPLNPAGQIAVNIDAKVYAASETFLYQTPWKIFGGQYAAAATVPCLWMEVEGDVQIGPFTGKRRDSASGLGDIQLLPVMLGWTNGDLKLGATLGLYAPTGDFQKGRLANAGKNYWTFEPGLSASWLSSKTGTELSLFSGYDTSTKNGMTGYQSGDSLHLDATVAQHLPLLGGFASAGAGAFYYQQVTGDRGPGATLGALEGRSLGAGPVLSYARKIGPGKKTDFVAEVKWLPELDVQHRLKGGTVWLKAALVF